MHMHNCLHAQMHQVNEWQRNEQRLLDKTFIISQLASDVCRNS